MNQLLIIYAIYFLVAAIASLLAYWLHRSSESRKARDEARRAQDDAADAQLALCCELAKPKWRQDRAFWERWADEHDLPQSTRRVLFAGMGDKQ